MRYWVFVAVMLCLTAGMAWAEGLPVLAVSADGADVQVHLKPAGAVIAVLPMQGEGNEQRRTVTALRQQGDWVRIRFDGKEEGWVRTEMLRACSALQGVVPLMSGSRSNSRMITEVQPWTPLYFVAMRKDWLQIDYRNAGNILVRGWLSVQSLATDPAQCWKPAP